MATLSGPLQPRKTPVQSRSMHTVASIHEATIQVLLDVGMERLTTTRVAERAGVSVGTLYQYFPNKRALLAGSLRRHLEAVVQEIEHACDQARGQGVDPMAACVVDAFITAKTRDIDTSRALYAVAAQVEGAAVVSEMTRRAQAALLELLSTAPGVWWPEARTVVHVWSTSMIGPVQGLLESTFSEHDVSTLREHLKQMLAGYLKGESRAKTRRLDGGEAPSPS